MPQKSSFLLVFWQVWMFWGPRKIRKNFFRGASRPKFALWTNISYRWVPIFPGALRPANENTAERSVHEYTDAFFCVYTNTIVTLWTAHMKKCKIKTDRISTELINYSTEWMQRMLWNHETLSKFLRFLLIFVFFTLFVSPHLTQKLHGIFGFCDNQGRGRGRTWMLVRAPLFQNMRDLTFMRLEILKNTKFI